MNFIRVCGLVGGMLCGSVLAAGVFVPLTHAATVTFETVPYVGDARDFVLGPGKLDLQIAAGTETTTEIVITNRLGVTREFVLSTEDVMGSYNPEQSVVLLGAERGPYTLREYVSFATTSVTLQQGERARVPVTIRVPKDAEPGGRYGSILVSVVSQDAVAASGAGTASKSAVVSRLGALLYVTVPGEIRREAVLREFRTIPDQWLFEQGPIPFEILIENTGTIHVTPYGSISIQNWLDETVGYIELEPWYAMPTSLRFREVMWDRPLLFGKYTATLEVALPDMAPLPTQTVTFYVIPWKGILLYVVGALGLVFVLRTLRRLLRHKRNRI